MKNEGVLVKQNGNRGIVVHPALIAGA